MPRKVYIAQLKCPNNHAVLGAVDEYESPEAAKALGFRLLDGFEKAVKDKVLKHECVICLSTDLRVHVDATIFTSLEKAMPFFRALEQAQAETAAMLKRSRN